MLTFWQLTHRQTDDIQIVDTEDVSFGTAQMNAALGSDPRDNLPT